MVLMLGIIVRRQHRGEQRAGAVRTPAGKPPPCRPSSGQRTTEMRRPSARVKALMSMASAVACSAPRAAFTAVHAATGIAAIMVDARDRTEDALGRRRHHAPLPDRQPGHDRTGWRDIGRLRRHLRPAPVQHPTPRIAHLC